MVLPLAAEPTGNQGPAAKTRDTEAASYRPAADNAPPAAGNLEVAGTYNLVSVDGHAVPYAPMPQGQRAPEIVSSTLTLNGDGTFVSTMSFGGNMSRDFKGTYAKEGADYVLTWEGAGQTGVTIAGGKLTMNNEGMLFVYQKAGVGATSAAAEQPAARSPEQVLDRFLGDWSCETTVYTPGANPEERRLTGRVSYTRVLGGRFVEETGEDSEKNSMIGFSTYDETRGCNPLSSNTGNSTGRGTSVRIMAVPRLRETTSGMRQPGPWSVAFQEMTGRHRRAKRVS